MNNNHLTELKGLYEFATKMYLKPSMIGWIDLSFNQLPNIDPVLLQFENLQILYLHANAITDIKEADKLAGLKKLRKLTLHGNEIENVKGQRISASHCLVRL
nr:hypothetical protein BaRGS_023236 [Batillaria attramentaria]